MASNPVARWSKGFLSPLPYKSDSRARNQSKSRDSSAAPNQALMSSRPSTKVPGVS